MERIGKARSNEAEKYQRAWTILSKAKEILPNSRREWWIFSSALSLTPTFSKLAYNTKSKILYLQLKNEMKRLHFVRCILCFAVMYIRPDGMIELFSDFSWRRHEIPIFQSSHINWWNRRKTFFWVLAYRKSIRTIVILRTLHIHIQ